MQTDNTWESIASTTFRTAIPDSGRSFTSLPATWDIRRFKLSIARIGVYICYDRHFPEGARILGLNGAEIVFNPSATVAGLSEYLWELEQPAHAVANGYFVGAINRVGTEKPWNIGEFYGKSYFCNPRGKIIAQASRDKDEVVVADLDLDMIEEVRRVWQFFRDRRPETYGSLTRKRERRQRQIEVIIPGTTRFQTHDARSRNFTAIRIQSSPLYNADLAPTTRGRRTWGHLQLRCAVGFDVGQYPDLHAGGQLDPGRDELETGGGYRVSGQHASCWRPMLLNSHPGARYGIPFPVLARASFGVLGANVAAVLRALVACGWFGIQTWIGGEAISTLICYAVPRVGSRFLTAPPSALWRSG